jgi:hypothetical protein
MGDDADPHPQEVGFHTSFLVSLAYRGVFDGLVAVAGSTW